MSFDMKLKEMRIEVVDVLIMWFLTLIMGAVFLIPFFSSAALMFSYFAALFSSPFLAISTFQVKYKPSFLAFQCTHVLVAVVIWFFLITSNMNFRMGSAWYTLYYFGIGIGVQLLWVLWLKEKVNQFANPKSDLIN